MERAKGYVLGHQDHQRRRLVGFGQPIEIEFELMSVDGALDQIEFDLDLIADPIGLGLDGWCIDHPGQHDQ